MKRPIFTLLGCFSIILLAAIFGSLIIWVTPLLYNIHPIIQNDVVKDSFTTVPHDAILYNDTIFLNSDTIVTHHSISKSDISETVPSNPPSMGDLGTFGDSAGFWNAIFSALAMVCVIVTLVYQSNKDRHEDERARLAQFQEQCLTMLSMLSDIVAQLRVSERTDDSFFSDVSLGIWDNNSNSPEPYGQTTLQNNRPEIKGRACFKYIYDERPENRNIKAFITKRHGRIDEDLFISLRSVMETQFDHYFRTVYRTLKFIKEQDLGNIPEDKQKSTRELCADLLRAQRNCSVKYTCGGVRG
ncbi:MAG: putative phage abortive infection protein [Muribaculum sp.]|nr:putative phage abortive infection protein [Muribaculum sp.]